MAFIGQDRAEFNLKRQQAQAQYQLGQGLLKMMGQQGQPQAGPRPPAGQVPPAQPGGKAPGSEWQNPPGSPGFVGPPAPQQQAQPDPRRQGPNGMTLNPATGLPMGWMPGQPTTGFNGPMMDRAQQSVGTYNQSQQTALANEQSGIAQQNAQTQQAWNAQPHPYAGMAEVTPQQYSQFQQQNNAPAGTFDRMPGLDDFGTQQAMRGQMKQYQQQQNVPGMLAGIRAEQAGPGLKAFPVREAGYGMLPMPQIQAGVSQPLPPPNAQQAISPMIPMSGYVNDAYSMLQNGVQSTPQDVQQWMSVQGQPPQMAQQLQSPPAPQQAQPQPAQQAPAPQPQTVAQPQAMPGGPEGYTRRNEFGQTLWTGPDGNDYVQDAYGQWQPMNVGPRSTILDSLGPMLNDYWNKPRDRERAMPIGSSPNGSKGVKGEQGVAGPSGGPSNNIPPNFMNALLFGQRAEGNTAQAQPKSTFYEPKIQKPPLEEDRMLGNLLLNWLKNLAAPQPPSKTPDTAPPGRAKL